MPSLKSPPVSFDCEARLRVTRDAEGAHVVFEDGRADDVSWNVPQLTIFAGGARGALDDRSGSASSDRIFAREAPR